MEELLGFLLEQLVSVIGQEAGSLNARMRPSRAGPRHCGQSCAAVEAAKATITTAVTPTFE